MLKIHNTISREKEAFNPIHKNEVSLYYCGPTVYWTQHIGNLRGALCTDLTVRTLKYLGYDVKYVRNYTDVGHLTSDSDLGVDKMEKASEREKLDPLKIAQKYIKIYEEDTSELNLLEPDVKPLATEHIQEMQDMIKTLVDKKFAYVTDLAIYFNVSKAKNYTCLSGQVLEANISGAGAGDISDPQKKSPHDFALWFFRAGTHKNALQYWPSPFNSAQTENGNGFPGWHIECSAMSKKHLGNTIDIHLGGIEHIPIHHTNEIAQSENANDAKFVNYWMHNEHLLVDNKKMAKSEGTSYSLEEIKAKGFQPLALRFLFSQAHYRSKLNFTWESLQAAQNGFNHLCEKVINLDKASKPKVDNDFKNQFKDALQDDFNIPEALAIAHKLLKSNLSDALKYGTIIDFDKVLGLNLAYCNKKEISEGLKDKINALIIERDQARKNKDWEKADKIRYELTKFKVSIEDK
ncbi:cysteine--tRNA ligase [Patescibacteria group bacterium]|nr:cysteine--tRNA ligase [Patescibacteria group bacterium]